MAHKVISVATSKGGAGKTTLCIALASAFAHAGGKVALIDTDVQRSLTAWGQAAQLPPGMEVLTETADEDKLMDLIDATKKTHHLTIVDVQGTKNTMAYTAMGWSDLIIVPLKPSSFDAAAAFETIQAILKVSRNRGEKIDFLAALNCLSPAIASRTAKSVRKNFAENDLELVHALCEREAFRSISAYGGSLFDLSDKQAPGLRQAREEALAFAQMIAERLGIAEPAAA